MTHNEGSSWWKRNFGDFGAVMESSGFTPKDVRPIAQPGYNGEQQYEMVDPGPHVRVPFLNSLFDISVREFSISGVTGTGTSHDVPPMPVIVVGDNESSWWQNGGERYPHEPEPAS